MLRFEIFVTALTNIYNVEIKTVLDLQHKFMYKTHFIFHFHAPKKPASAHLRVLE